MKSNYFDLENTFFQDVPVDRLAKFISRLDLYRKIGSGSYSKIVDFENGFLYTNSTATNTGRFAVSFLDEPSNADTIKYKMQFNSGPNGASVVINPDAQETSSIILQEVIA